jgi:hypothetical protein
MPSQEEDWTIGMEEQDSSFTAKKYIDPSNVWIVSYKFCKPVSYNSILCSFRDNYNTCTITMQKSGNKPEDGLDWKKLGKLGPMSNTIVINSLPKDSYSACIVYKQQINANVNMYGFRFRPCVKLGIQIGHHLSIHLDGKRTFCIISNFSLQH